jgi:hypothetical protein
MKNNKPVTPLAVSLPKPVFDTLFLLLGTLGLSYLSGERAIVWPIGLAVLTGHLIATAGFYLSLRVSRQVEDVCTQAPSKPQGWTFDDGRDAEQNH